MNQFIFSSRLLLAALYFLPFLSRGQSGTMSDPIVIPILFYSDSRSNTSFGNTYSRAESPYFGQPSPDIFYRFRILVPGELKVSTCGSDFNTYIHLLSQDGTPVYHNDDNGSACTGAQASMSVNLDAGTYYIVMEGAGSATGVITSTVRFLGQFRPNDPILPPNPGLPLLPDTLNFTRVWEVLSPTRDAGALMFGGSREARQRATYYDGLGRPVQTVDRQGSLPSGSVARDLVMPVTYDARGREAEKYLPYADGTSDGRFKENVLPAQAGFYSSASSPLAGQGESHFYSRTVFEPSPLGRASLQMAPGANWTGAGRGVSSSYEVNTSADSVRLWEVGPPDATSGFGPLNSAGIYAAGTLYKTVTTDEAGKKVVEFTDLGSRVVLKKVQASLAPSAAHTGWLCTYYIYDDLERLRAVLQPAAVEALAALSSHSWVPDPVMLSELAFRYEYDSRGRLTIKQVPGAGPVYMVYDARDRLVMTQDAAMRTADKWIVTRYDDLNRPIATGLWTNSQDLSVHLAQAYHSVSYPSAVLPASFEGLTETHYDDYLGLPAGLSPSLVPGYAASLNASAASPEYAEPVLSSTRTRGLVTWTSTKVLGTGAYLDQSMIYDDKARALQTQSTNVTGGTDVVTTQYDFAGRILRSHLSHHKGGAAPQNLDIATKNSYDDLGRITSVEKNINGSGWKAISAMEYDALGQLRQKKLSPGYNNGQGLESLTYDYNIRGWLLGVNRGYLLARNTAGYAGRFFGFELGYDKPASLAGTSFTSQQFNGNIAGTVWKSAGDEARRKYDFAYDAASRFGKADFTQNTDPSGAGTYNTAGGNFSVHGPDPANGSMMTYDANGNILSMVQHGIKALTPDAVIDHLSYSYYPGSNKLRQVTDLANDQTSTLGDFKYDPATKTTADYSYDANGNLVTDLNKQISAITYNHLNLAKSITVAGKGSIEYGYDASGNKLSKTVHETGQPDKVTLYLGGMVYQNDSLEFFSHEEGRVRPISDVNGQGNAYAYDYFIKDHLGNVRMVLTEQETRDAYPAASLEQSTLQQEKLFYQVPEGASRVSKSSVPAYPESDSYTSPNEYVQKLNGSNQKLGTSIVLRVMSGDRVNIRATSWYRQNGPAQKAPASGVLRDVVASLAQGIAAVPGAKTSLSAINQEPGLSSGLGSFLSQQDNQASSPSKPKSYLNWLLLDEQLNPVITNDGKNSGFQQVGPDQELTILQVTERPLTKNGYLYIYLSNETPGTDVFFDNLQVTHIKGPLLEETHYYPFGLMMAGISSKAAGGLENKKGYNGNELQSKEFTDGSGLEFYDFNARTYEHQIGRFIQVDPESEEADQESWSPYHFSYNNPVRYNDPDGRLPIIPIIWGLYELGSAIYDGYQAYKTVNDKNASSSEKVAAVGGVLLSTVLPGGGYGTAAKATVKAVDKATDAAKIFKKATVAANIVETATDASKSLPQLKGKSIPKIEKTLNKQGFRKVKDNGKNQKFKHNDGSEVRIHKYGNEDITEHNSANNAHVHKQDQNGNQLNDRGITSTDPNATHIGVKNPKDLPQVRNRPHGSRN